MYLKQELAANVIASLTPAGDAQAAADGASASAALAEPALPSEIGSGAYQASYQST